MLRAKGDKLVLARVLPVCDNFFNNFRELLDKIRPIKLNQTTPRGMLDYAYFTIVEGSSIYRRDDRV